MTRPSVIVGCGYLGARVASAWLGEGRRVVALTRGRNPGLPAGVEPVVGDVLDPASLAQLPEAETLLYAVGLDRSAGRSMRAVYVEGLMNVLAAIRPPRRFIYISSTGVYGDRNGDWVDETSEPDGDEESNRIVRDAERTLADVWSRAIILRFAGIYGPGRIIGRAGLLAGQPVTGDPDRYLNLIHVADGVRAIRAAETKAVPGQTYNVSDDEPVSRREYYSTAATILGASPPVFVGEGGGPNRRIGNRRARAELEFVPVYRSCREGLAASV